MKVKLLKKIRKGLSIEKIEIKESSRKKDPVSIYYIGYLNATREDYEDCSIKYTAITPAIQWVHRHMRERIRNYTYNSTKIWP